MITVIEAISRPAFHGSAVVGGWAGLRQPVAAITVAEVPDSAHWLAGGELVLTTAYMVRGDPDGFVRWMRSLAEYGAAGLAVKSQRFLGTLPTEVMREADRLQLPLISLPYAVNWPNLIKPVTEAILLRSGGLDAETALDRFLALLDDRAGFNRFCQTLAELCHCTVVLTDMQGRILGLGMPGMETSPQAIRAVLDNRAGLADWQARPDQSGTAAWQHQLEGGIAVRNYPLQSQTSIRGVLTLLTGGSPLTDAALTIADAWAAALALTYERFAANHEVPTGERGTELLQLLEGGPVSLPGADHPLTRALTTPGFVATVQLHGEDALAEMTLSAHRRGPETRLLSVLDEWLRTRDPLAAVAVSERKTVVIAHAPDPQAWATQLYEFLMEQSSTKQVMIGVGGAAADVSGYRRSLDQARGALRLLEQEGAASGIRLYDRLGIRRVLADLGDLSRVQPFARERLAPLLQSDPSLHLLDTLRAYLQANGRIPQTAKALFVHPNTVRYRLRRIETLAGVNLGSIDDQAQLWLALHVHDLTDV